LHHAELFAFVIDNADFRDANVPIRADPGLPLFAMVGYERPPKKNDGCQAPVERGASAPRCVVVTVTWPIWFDGR